MKKIPITVEEIESLMKQSFSSKKETIITDDFTPPNNSELGVPSETMN
jgi:hypothetical protein